MKKQHLEKIRETVLKEGHNLIKRAFQNVDDRQPVFRTRDDELLFHLVGDLVKDADTPVNFEFTGATINEKIDSIMQGIAQGRITPRQGTQLMEILRGGFEIVQVSELMDTLQKAGLIENTVR